MTNPTEKIELAKSRDQNTSKTYMNCLFDYTDELCNFDLWLVSPSFSLSISWHSVVVINVIETYMYLMMYC